MTAIILGGGGGGGGGVCYQNEATYGLSATGIFTTLINAFLGNRPKKWCTSSMGCNTAFNPLKMDLILEKTSKMPSFKKM